MWDLTPALLKGIIFTDTGTAMTPTKKGTRLYRYYASMDLIRNRPTGDTSGPLRLPAGMVEDAVVGEIRRMIRAPEIAARTIKRLPSKLAIRDACLYYLLTFNRLRRQNLANYAFAPAATPTSRSLDADASRKDAR